MPIQLVLTAGLTAVLAYVFVQRAAPRIVKLATMAIALVGIYFVWMPGHTTIVANWLGVGRGTDLLIYLWIVLSLAFGLNLNFKVRAARREITELTRALALASPRTPTPDDEDERTNPTSEGGPV
jgi:hypothetical protein